MPLSVQRGRPWRGALVAAIVLAGVLAGPAAAEPWDGGTLDLNPGSPEWP